MKMKALRSLHCAILFHALVGCALPGPCFAFERRGIGKWVNKTLKLIVDCKGIIVDTTGAFGEQQGLN